MVKIARPCRIIHEYDTLDVYFTACSILDGELVLWGQLIDIDDNEGTLYNSLDEKIKLDIDNGQHHLSPRDIQPGQSYLIRYNLDNKWYRAKVMNCITDVNGGAVKYRVQYTDFGNVDIVHLSDIRQMTNTTKSYRNLAYKFKLKSISPRNGYWDVNGGILRWLDKEIILRKLLVRVIKVDDDEFVIESETITMVLQKHNFCAIVEDWRYEINGFISEIDPFDPLRFSIHHDDHEGETLDTFSQMINNVYKSMIAPKKLDKALCISGTYCISLYKDGNFYRAQILSSDLLRSSCTIKYIDYGNIASVPSNSLCVIQPQFINVPPYSLQCRIHNSKLITENHRKTVYDEFKAVTGFGSQHNQFVTATVIFCERHSSDLIYHVRCSVLQSKFNLQSLIQLNSLNFTQRIQEDVTTRPKSRSPFCTREQIINKKPLMSLPSDERVKSYQTYACSVTWIEKNLEIYLHILSDISELENFSDSLNEFYGNKAGHLVATNPGMKVGSIYVGQWSRDCCFYRIIYQGSGVVIFIDFGNCSKISTVFSDGIPEEEKDFVYSDVYYLEEEFSRPPYAVRCAPNGFKSHDWLEYIYQEQLVIDVIFRRKKDKDWIVNILDEDIESTLSETVDLRLECDEYKGSFAFIDDHRNRIFVHFEKFAHMLVKVEDIIDEIVHVHGLEVETELMDGLLVFAVYQDGRIHRAKVLEIAEIGVTVQFIDYGNYDTIPFDYVFKYVHNNLGYVDLAFEVEIDGLDLTQLIDPNSFFRFLQLFSHEELVITIIEKNGILKVDLQLSTGEDLIKKAFEKYIVNIVGDIRSSNRVTQLTYKQPDVVDLNMLHVYSPNSSQQKSSNNISINAQPFVPRKFNNNNYICTSDSQSSSGKEVRYTHNRCL